MRIHFNQVQKVYSANSEKPVVAVDNVHFTIEDGEFVSVLGPSGCGKSTLLMMLAGLENISSGSIFIDEEKVESPQTNLGIVFQKPVLLPWRSVLDNIMLQSEIRNLSKSELKERALQLLDITGLENFAEKLPHELSGGMQQRVSIARALVHNPPLLLMDEPFAALDALTREQMTDLLYQIWNESRKTVLFITHSIQEAVMLSDKVVVLSPRPSQIEEILTIDLPRPRNMNDPGFVEYSQKIRRIFEAQGVL